MNMIVTKKENRDDPQSTTTNQIYKLERTNSRPKICDRSYTINCFSQTLFKIQGFEFPYDRFSFLKWKEKRYLNANYVGQRMRLTSSIGFLRRWSRGESITSKLGLKERGGWTEAEEASTDSLDDDVSNVCMYVFQDQATIIIF